MNSKCFHKLIFLPLTFGCLLCSPVYGLEKPTYFMNSSQGLVLELQIEKTCASKTAFPAVQLQKSSGTLGGLPAVDGTVTFEYSFEELVKICQEAQPGGERTWKAFFSLRLLTSCDPPIAGKSAPRTIQFSMECTLMTDQLIHPRRPMMCCDDEPLPSGRYEIEVVVGGNSSAGSRGLASGSPGPTPLAFALKQRALGEPSSHGGQTLNEVDLDDYGTLALAFTYPLKDRWGVRVSASAAEPDVSQASVAAHLPSSAEARLRALDLSLVRSWSRSRYELFSSVGAGWHWLKLDLPGPGDQRLDSPTLNLGAGLTLPLGERWFVRPQTHARWILDDSALEWGVGVGLGLRFGGSR